MEEGDDHMLSSHPHLLLTLLLPSEAGATRVLISTNVTARGIDVQQVSTVINFDIPRDVHTYLHRAGRSGRWGRKGTCINFVTKHDIESVQEIEAYYATTFEELTNSAVATGK